MLPPSFLAAPPLAPRARPPSIVTQKKNKRLLAVYLRPGCYGPRGCASVILGSLRWLSTVLAVCEYMSFVKSWQEKGCSSQAETWQVKNILMKDFD